MRKEKYLCEVCVYGGGGKCRQKTSDVALAVLTAKCAAFIPADAIAALSKEAGGMASGSVTLTLRIKERNFEGFSTQRKKLN